jgi:hypothetical protein
MPAKTTKILFVGNSFTARNDLPALLAQLAATDGKSAPLEAQIFSAGGASLRTHLNKGEVQEALEQSQWDYVVLQEQSTLPAKNAKRMGENVQEFDRVIKSSGATTVLYMTWARQDAPDTQQTIADAYTSIGTELGAIVVPVGIAWRHFLDQYCEPVLHDKDKSHPSLAGSYLAACVFDAVLFGGQSAGLPDGAIDLDPAARKNIQKVARETAREFKRIRR